MLGGLRRHGRWLLKESFPADEFSGRLLATREAETKLALARAARGEAGRKFAACDLELTSWLAKARLVVMLAYGNKWSESWIAAGFTHRGTNVPKRIAPRIELCQRLADFFAGHEEYEVPFARVTAAEARRQKKEITAAEKAVRLARQKMSERKRVRDVAEKKLRHEMHFVVVYLGCAIGKRDPRWRAFGLKQPRTDAEPIDVYCKATPSSPAIEVDFAAADVKLSSAVA